MIKTLLEKLEQGFIELEPIPVDDQYTIAQEYELDNELSRETGQLIT